jgi:hypothetical protein
MASPTQLVGAHATPAYVIQHRAAFLHQVVLCFPDRRHRPRGLRYSVPRWAMPPESAASDRKVLLKSMFANTAIEYSEHFEIDGAELYRRACEAGLEGIVSKVASSPYAGPGRQQVGRHLCRPAEGRRVLKPLIRKTQPYTKRVAHKGHLGRAEAARRDRVSREVSRGKGAAARFLRGSARMFDRARSELLAAAPQRRRIRYPGRPRLGERSGRCVVSPLGWESGSPDRCHSHPLRRRAPCSRNSRPRASACCLRAPGIAPPPAPARMPSRFPRRRAARPSRSTKPGATAASKLGPRTKSKRPLVSAASAHPGHAVARCRSELPVIGNLPAALPRFDGSHAGCRRCEPVTAHHAGLALH